jgi:DNA-binding Lrp family transcriptional regulator
MAAKAFVLIETAVGKTKEVVAKVRQLEGVKSVDPVTGPYDIITIIEAESLNNIGNLVTGKIHPIAGISRTVTCLAIWTEETQPPFRFEVSIN